MTSTCTGSVAGARHERCPEADIEQHDAQERVVDLQAAQIELTYTRSARGPTASIPARLNHRDVENWKPRQVDGEDAAPFRQVARVDPAMVRFDAPSAEGEAQAEPGAVGAALLERAEQCRRRSPREPAAFVLDLDEHALGAGADA